MSHELKDRTLINVFMRILEVSPHTERRDFTTPGFDPTSGVNYTAFAFLEEGIGKVYSVKDYSEFCERNAYGNYHGAKFQKGGYNADCLGCELFQEHVAKECFLLNQGGWENCVGRQLVQIKVQELYGTSIKVYNYVTGELLMECFYSSKQWWQRKTPNKPQATLRDLFWNARFISREDAYNIRSHWDDDDYYPPWVDPFGNFNYE